MRYLLIALIALSGCGETNNYPSSCPLNNQPTAVQQFFSGPVQCVVQAPYLHCMRVQ